jgi:chitinase
MKPEPEKALSRKMYMTISLGLLNGFVEEKINYLINSLLVFSFDKVYIKFPYFKPKENVIDEEFGLKLKKYFKENSVLTLSVQGNEAEIKFLEEDISASIPEAVVVVERF